MVLNLVILQPIKAQFLDSIKTSFYYKPKLDVKADLRNSFITTSLARIVGLKVGLNYNDRVIVGLGYNVLFSDLQRSQGEEYRKLRFNYFSPYIVYKYFKQRKWELSIPVHIGIGTVDYVGLNESVFGLSGKFVMLYEPYMVGEYRVIRYLGLGAGMGYRLLFMGNSFIGENFNSPIYVFKVKLYLNEIFKTITGKRN